jgi:DNA-binding MurR/RpiR family transcriptional regulator
VMKKTDIVFKRLRLEDKVQRFSRSQKALGRFILKNYHRIAFMTIRQFAKSSGISEATIIRFVTVLGFKGYPSFQKEIRIIVRAELKGPDRFKSAEDPPRKDQTLLQNIMDKEVENISHLQEAIHKEDLSKAVRAIENAGEILIVGTRSTAPLAYHFSFGLAKLGKRVVRITAITTETYDLINRLDRQALVIVIGFPRYLRELVDLLTFSKEKKLRTLTITDSPFSPLMGDIRLFSEAESTSFMAFHGAPMVLINTLIIELSLLNNKKTLKELNRFEKIAEVRNYFYKT